MEVRFDTVDGKGKIYIKNGKTNLWIEKGGESYKKINEKLQNGYLEIKDFKNSGIPGKIKSYRDFQSSEDIVKFLRKLKDEYLVINIATINKLEDKKYNNIKLDYLTLKGKADKEYFIREHRDLYEYCLIENYEEEYKDHRVHIVQFSQVFIKFVKMGDLKKILSINFSKDDFDIGKLGEWIIDKKIEILDNKEDYVKDVLAIEEGILFDDNIILLYKKGPRDLPIDRTQLVSIKDNLFAHEASRNIFYAKKMEAYKTSLDIYLYGEKIDYIPEIELNENDLLFCNDVIINAKYIGDYEKSIGFFKDKSCKEPVAWILSSYKKIEVVCEPCEEHKMIFVEYKTDKLSFL